MKGLSISCRSSEASISLDGAHVGRLSLDGQDVIKPSGDGAPTHGGIAVLIPYAGRVRRGRYRFEGRRFSLPVGPGGHAIHGFAKDARWEAVKEGPRTVTLRSLLKGEGYPGTLDAQVTYSVQRDGFSTACRVRNVGAAGCPLVVGFHPYFLARRWKVSVGRRAFRYTLGDGYFPTGDAEPYSFASAGPEAGLDDCFRVDGDITLQNEEYSLLITRRKMPYVVVYNGKYAEGSSVAIEPYTGLPDAYNNGIGLARLGPAETFECAYGVRLSRPRRAHAPPEDSAR